MRLDVELRLEHFVGLDHADGLIECEVGHFLRRRDEQELGTRPLVDQQRGEHQPGTVGGLGILLRHEAENLLHETLAQDVRVAAEQHAHDVAEPVAGSGDESRLAGYVGQAQLVEDGDRPHCGSLEQRQVGCQ